MKTVSPNIYNKTSIPISKNKMNKIVSLFSCAVYNFPWNGWLKDRKGYYGCKVHKHNGKRKIYKINLPYENFDLLVHTKIDSAESGEYDMPYRIYIVKNKNDRSKNIF